MNSHRLTTMLIVSASIVFGQESLVWSGYRAPASFRFAPGQIVTLFAVGLNVQLTGPQYATSFPLPASLLEYPRQWSRGHSRTLYPYWPSNKQTRARAPKGTPRRAAPVTAITVEIPFDLNANAGSSSVAGVTVSANGAPSALFPLQPMTDNIHVLTTCDTVLGSPTTGTSGCAAMVTHPDGSIVSASSPAIPGETVVIYAVGLGQTNPLMQTGTATPNPPPIIGNSISNLGVQFDFNPNAGPSRPYTLGGGPSSFPPKVATFVGLTPGYAGLYQINVPIPSLPSLPPPVCIGNVVSNLTINLGGQTSFDGAPICVRANSLEGPQFGGTSNSTPDRTQLTVSISRLSVLDRCRTC